MAASPCFSRGGSSPCPSPPPDACRPPTRGFAPSHLLSPPWAHIPSRVSDRCEWEPSRSPTALCMTGSAVKAGRNPQEKGVPKGRWWPGLGTCVSAATTESHSQNLAEPEQSDLSCPQHPSRVIWTPAHAPKPVRGQLSGQGDRVNMEGRFCFSLSSALGIRHIPTFNVDN